MTQSTNTVADGVTPTAATTSPDVPPSAAELLIKRTTQVALALKLGSVYEFTKLSKGPVLNTDKPVIPHSWVSGRVVDILPPEVVSAPFVRSIPLVPTGRGAHHQVDLPIGVTAVMGRSGSGKTRTTFDHLFLSEQARGHSPLYVKMHEPGDETRLRLLAQPGNLEIPDFEIHLANALAAALVNPLRELIIVDSLRYLFYSSTGGATGKGGVNMPLFMDLTHLDTVATRLRKRVVVVINPMTDDEAAFNFYVEAAKGALAGVIVTKDAFNGLHTNRYARDRELRPFSIPKVAVTDTTAPTSAQSAEIGNTSTANVSVNAAIFGRNR